MSHERAHSHASSTESSTTDTDDDATPGRTSRSSQLFRKGDNGVAANAEDAVSAASSSTGSSLPAAIMRKFEGSLGTDLSSVRVHTGSESASAASAVGARAYATGQDIHFGAGQYDPGSSGGQHLLAHEVAHTVQQRGGSPTRQNKLEVSSPHDAAEHEADRAADAMVSGSPFSVGNAALTAARTAIYRDKEQPAQPEKINPKYAFDLGELKLGKPIDANWITLSAAVKGKGSIEQMVPDGEGGGTSAIIATGTSASTHGGVGGKAEIAIAEEKLKSELWGAEFEQKNKTKLTFELTTEKLQTSVGWEGRVNWVKLPWLKGASDVTFHFATVKWEDIMKDPSNVKVGAIEGAIGLAGDGTYTTDLGRAYKTTLTGQVGVTAAPNWAKIGAEVGKQVAKSGAQTAATATGTGTATAAGATSATAGAGATTATGAGAATATGTGAAGTTAATGAGAAAADGVAGALAIDGMAVAGSAAAVIVPLAVGAAMIAGAMQMEKNVVASKAANTIGITARDEARAYVKAYVATIAGGSGSGAGALEANAKVMAAMAATGKNRADACAELLAKNGGRQGLETDILAKLRAEAYTRGVAAFEVKFASHFGPIERIGETWGMRGVFRKDFRGYLYSD